MTLPAENIQAQPNDTKQKELEQNFAQQRKYYEKQMAEQKAAFDARLTQIEQERQQNATTYDSDDDSSDDYINRKTFHRELDKKLHGIDKKIDEKAEQKARTLVEQERQANYLRYNSDFHQILTPENVQKFAEKHPEVAEPMLEMPDNFARQKLLYQNIKALGVHKPPEPARPIQEAVDKARKSAYYQPSGMSAAPYANNGDFSATGQKSAYQKMQDLISKRKG